MKKICNPFANFLKIDFNAKKIFQKMNKKYVKLK